MKSLLKVAIVCACVYGVVRWQAIAPQDNDVIDFAKSACVGEIGHRYTVSNIRAYEVRQANNGLSVRASATSANGTAVKIVCLTNSQGGVRDIMIDER